MSEGIPIGMEMESPGCIRAFKAACRVEEEKRRLKRKRTGLQVNQAKPRENK